MENSTVDRLSRRDFAALTAAAYAFGTRSTAFAAAEGGFALSRAKTAFADYVKAYWDEARGQFRLHKKGDKLLDFWFAAHSFDMLLDAVRVIGGKETRRLAIAFYDGFMKRYPDWKKNESNDDILWWTIACVRASRCLGDRRYLAQAKSLFNHLLAHEVDGELGGGMWWKNSEHKSKNACDNFPAVITACGLHKATGDAKYRKAALDLYAWGREKLFNVKTGAIEDNIDISGKVTHWHFSYNSGTFIGSALRLWRITREKVYLDDAFLAAKYMTTSLSRDGVLKPTGQGDGGAFNGIGIRYLCELAQTAEGAALREFVRGNAESVWQNRRKSDGLPGPDWTRVPADDFDIEGQTANSGLVALVLVAGMKGK